MRPPSLRPTPRITAMPEPIAAAAVPTPRRGRGAVRAGKPSTKTLVLRLTDDEHDALARLARERGTSMSEVVRTAIHAHAPPPVRVLAQPPARPVPALLSRTDEAAVVTLRQINGTLRQALGLSRGNPLHGTQLRTLLAATLRTITDIRNGLTS